jgi:O-antigen/teichoic acid export membrane protein
LKVSAGRVGALVWILIYGGLLLCGLGIALTREGQAYGWGVCAAGIGAVVAGALLIWVRSRMAESVGPPP